MYICYPGHQGDGKWWFPPRALSLHLAAKIDIHTHTQRTLICTSRLPGSALHFIKYGWLHTHTMRSASWRVKRQTKAIFNLFSNMHKCNFDNYSRNIKINIIMRAIVDLQSTPSVPRFRPVWGPIPHVWSTQEENWPTDWAWFLPRFFSPFCHRWSFGSLPLMPLACLVGDT